MERETLEFDVVFVGAGPANLSGALHLARLVKQGNSLGDVEIAVIEKGAAVGSHILSGAVMDPKALRELIPDFEAQGAPIEGPVQDDLMYFLLQEDAVQVPFLPPSLQQHGNLIISLGQMVRWLAKQAEGLGINVFPGFPAVDALVENGQV